MNKTLGITGYSFHIVSGAFLDIPFLGLLVMVTFLVGIILLYIFYLKPIDGQKRLCRKNYPQISIFKFFCKRIKSTRKTRNINCSEVLLYPKYSIVCNFSVTFYLKKDRN